jgi:23S rRNA pseudouridine1911/1915/1917 synthase
VASALSAGWAGETLRQHGKTCRRKLEAFYGNSEFYCLASSRIEGRKSFSQQNPFVHKNPLVNCIVSPLRVLYEDNHLLVVDKPVGIATMGVAQNEMTMAGLAAQYLKQKYSKPGNVYVGIVSRLDRLVSGVLLMARTSKAASRLSTQFRERQVKKRYLTCVEGQIEGEFGQWFMRSDHLAKNEARQRMEVTTPGNNRGQEACLRYRLLSENRGCSLLEIELLTGRKHQIRAQLAALGHAILGDRKYGSEESFAQGIALHCHSLEIVHPTLQTPKHFCSLPEHWPGKIANLVNVARPLFDAQASKPGDTTQRHIFDEP